MQSLFCSAFARRMDKEGDQQSGGKPKNPMTKEDAARIQGSYAKQHDGKVDEGSFPARAQAAADKRENQPNNQKSVKTRTTRTLKNVDCPKENTNTLKNRNL